MTSSSFLKAVVFSLIVTVGVSFYLYPNLRSFSALASALNLRRNASINTAIGPAFGLKISLILASFYAAQGFSSLLNRPSKRPSKTVKSAPLLNQIPFHFMEIPVLLGLIVFGSVVMPTAVVQKYTMVLAGFAPVMPILEVVALVTVVMATGRTWTPKIIESHDFIKFLVILACFASIFASSTIIYLIYAHFRLSTLIASLLSSILTLLVVQIITCCQLDHATITDPALIFPYISYNLILIVLKSGMRALLDHQRDPQIYPKNPQTFLKLVEFIFTTSTPSLSRQILQTIFSPVLIFHILLQLALLTVAETTEEEPEDVDDEESFVNKLSIYLLKSRQIFVSSLWPLFGKSFLVVIYTISWLEQCHPETLSTALTPKSIQIPFYLDSAGFWRWVAVAGALTAYGKHLIFDGYSGNNEGGKNDYKCDKAFWRQFHNLKD